MGIGVGEWGLGYRHFAGALDASGRWRYQDDAISARRECYQLGILSYRAFGFFRRMLNHLGFKKEDEERRSDPMKTKGGFRTKMAVPVSGIADGPVVSQCNYGNGGVQGLRWYSEMLRADDDGDIAQEFLHESVSVGRNNKKRTRFQVQMRTRFVKLKGPLCALDGNVHQFVESGGEVYWA